MDYFNSDNHVKQQCAKIERMMNRKINPIKVKEMNNYLLSRYYPLKPKQMRDDIFLKKLSIKSIYDVCERVIDEEKRKGRPIKGILVNNQNKGQSHQGIGTNGEKINMTYQRAPILNQNKIPLQPVNYQSMLKDLNVQNIDKPDETEIMKHIKENQNSWQNTGKNKDNTIQQPLQQTQQQYQNQLNQQPPTQPQQYQQLPQQSTQQQIQQPIQQQLPQQQMTQPDNLMPASNGSNNDLNSFDSLFSSGSLLDGISEADKQKFQNAGGPIQTPEYKTINIPQGPPPQVLQ